MQHLDEGTIHSWLDGALSADEAARVEAHVKECPQCAAAVAEARGFIAASSRILTALDNAPRGVMPAAIPRKRVDPIVWRIAATMLVVAAGTLVVVRNRGADEQLMSAKTDGVTFSSQPTAATEQAPPAAGPASTSTADAPQKAARGRAPTSQAPTLAPSRVATVAAMDAATVPEALKVVGTQRQISAKVTLYEIAPGDTVTLTESIPVALKSIMIRGATSAPMAQQAREKSAAAPSKLRADATITPPSESRAMSGVAGAAQAVPAPAPPSEVMANAVHTITWTDSVTGTTLVLSGRMPEAQLEEIKIRINRERAAAAAKKNP